MKKAEIKFRDRTAGWLTLDGDGYHFTYDEIYLEGEEPEPVSLTLPLQKQPFTVARWPRDKEGNPVNELKGSFRLYRDSNDEPVLLLEKEWDLNWAKKENPDVDFAASITSVRKDNPYEL